MPATVAVMLTARSPAPVVESSTPVSTPAIEMLKRLRRTIVVTVLRVATRSHERCVETENCGEVELWTFYCGQYFEVDLFDLPVDRHCPLSLQDAPRRSLSSTHIVVYKVAGKGSVGCAS